MNLNPFAKLLLLTIGFIICLAISHDCVRAQGGNDSDWQTLRPEGEEFTILMPKDLKSEESQEPYHKMTLNTRLYLSATEKGPVFAVMSLSGIKSNPALYTEFQRLNSYVDAFKTFFPSKVRGKDAVAKLTLVGDKTLNGNAGREYKVVIGDLSGTAQTFATRKRFYAVVVLNTKKDDALTDRFLSSFVLPEKVIQETTVATTAPPTPENPANAKPGEKKNPEDTQRTDANAEAGNEPKPDEGTAKPRKPGERAPINGGVLNGKAISLPPPEYPGDLKASDTVVVQVLVDEAGTVISAHAVSGHPLLQAAAVAAARQARFAPTSLMGEPVKVSGVITYTFTAR